MVSTSGDVGSAVKTPKSDPMVKRIPQATGTRSQWVSCCKEECGKSGEEVG